MVGAAGSDQTAKVTTAKLIFNASNGELQANSIVTGGSFGNISGANLISSNSYAVFNYGLVINSSGEWVGESVNGATGGGTDKIFYENEQTMTTDYTISSNRNAMTTGPLTINSNVVLTVSSGARYVVI
jgi:hypothetical protein